MIYESTHIFFLLVFIYTAVNLLYLFIASVAGYFYQNRSYSAFSVKKRIAVLITSFKEDEVIVNTAYQASVHKYADFDVYLAADQLQLSTMEALYRLKINTVPVVFKNGSKARSLNYLLNYINEADYDIAVVLDGDNIMDAGFLEKINTSFHRNYKAVQGHRTAKNKNTPVALLDAISEEINNHLFRQAQRVFGFSSSTIGSGMAFEFSKLKEIYNKPGILDNPACDREVDFEMMKSGIVVEYIRNAYVYDEKVSGQKVYQTQRMRWMESQVIHLRLFLKEKVPNKTKDYWNKLFINLIPPRILFIGLFGVLFFIYLLQYFIHTSIIGIPFTAWLILLLVYVSTMLLSIPRSLYSLQSLKALLYLPVLLFALLSALAGMKSSRKEFIHTPKSFTGKDIL